MSRRRRMYADVVTWSPFQGCHFDCVYCRPSFQAQAKRQKQRCLRCYDYTPHEHPERLDRMPPGQNTVFVCSSGDISFCHPEYTREIIAAIRRDAEKNPDRDYYLQSKRPEYFEQFLDEYPDKALPQNAILVTTLETNRDEGYEDFSKAPPPSQRWSQFYLLDWPRKAVTAEPLMDFDVPDFADMLTAIGVVPRIPQSYIKSIKPEHV